MPVDKHAKQLAQWVEETSNPETIKKISKEAEFNLKPLFGAKKKRMKLIAEVLSVKISVAIHVAHQTFRKHELQPIVDTFLEVLYANLLVHVDERSPSFNTTCQERLREYSTLYDLPNPGYGLSAKFLMNLHGKNTSSNKSFKLLGERFAQTIEHCTERVQGVAANYPSSSRYYWNSEIQTLVHKVLQIQLLPKGIEVHKLPRVMMTNNTVAGYVFGLHEALAAKLGTDQLDDSEANVGYIQNSYKSLFGGKVGSSSYVSASESFGDNRFEKGRDEGRDDLHAFLDDQRPPIGLTEIFIHERGGKIE